jgi:hypothetical protein
VGIVRFEQRQTNEASPPFIPGHRKLHLCCLSYHTFLDCISAYPDIPACATDGSIKRSKESLMKDEEAGLLLV